MMKKDSFKQLAALLLSAAILTTTTTCSKDSEECLLQDYKIVCSIQTWDPVFGGYDTGESEYTIQAHCPEDAQKQAKDMSYDYGNIYQHCHVVE